MARLRQRMLADMQPRSQHAEIVSAAGFQFRQTLPTHARITRTRRDSARGRNFLRTMLRLGADRDELSVDADQFGVPTWANTIAPLSAGIVAQALVGRDDWWPRNSGVYHLTASVSMSWAGFAQAIDSASGFVFGMV